MDEPKKSGFKSPFKFNFTTASLTPNRKKDPANGSGLSILKPRKGLDGLNTSGPGSEDGKNQWSTMSPLRSTNSMASQSKSESRINTLGRFEGGDKLTTTDISLKENGVNAIAKSGSFTEDKSGSSNVKRMHHSNYDRPRSQVYTSTPLTGFVTPENHYDTPKTQPVLTPDKSGSQGNSLGTNTSSARPHEVQYNTSVSKTLFPSGDKSREQTEKSDQRYNEVGINVMKQGPQNQRDGLLLPRDNANNDVGHNKRFSQELKSPKRTPIPADLSLNLQQTPSPVAPPRKQCSGSSSMLKSSSFSSPSSQKQSVVSPTAKPRKKWLTRQISLEPKKLDDDEFIGFASLPDQVHRKAVKRGFEFCLMVVGETGLGKSTLINSLFLTDLYKERKIPDAQECVDRTIEIIKKQLEIEERGVKVRLSVVDTPGFNDAVNGDENWRPVVEYVDRQFEQYFNAESGVNRKNIQDTRVHCCLYFISPYGHGLKPIDILVMKKLHNKVNIVPLIAKSDILTPKEVKRLKLKVLEEIQKHNINIYQFPECDSDEDEEFKNQNTALKSAIPFAVVGSNTVVEVAGKKIRGRMYPWGIVEVDNPKHCDFIKLRQMLISTHMQDLKDITADAHYENYRAEHLLASEMQRSQRERTKLKRESIIGSDSLNDTDSLLAQKEAEIQRMQEMMIQLQAQLQTSPRGQVNGQARNT